MKNFEVRKISCYFQPLKLMKWLFLGLVSFLMWTLGMVVAYVGQYLSKMDIFIVGQKICSFSEVIGFVMLGIWLIWLILAVLNGLKPFKSLLATVNLKRTVKGYKRAYVIVLRQRAFILVWLPFDISESDKLEKHLIRAKKALVSYIKQGATASDWLDGGNSLFLGKMKVLKIRF